MRKSAQTGEGGPIGAPPAVPPSVTPAEAADVAESEEANEVPISEPDIFGRDLGTYMKINQIGEAMPADVQQVFDRIPNDFDRARAADRYSEVIENLRRSVANGELRDALATAGYTDEMVSESNLDDFHRNIQDPYEDQSLNEAIMTAREVFKANEFPNIAQAMDALKQEMQNSFVLASSWRRTVRAQEAPPMEEPVDDARPTPLEADKYRGIDELMEDLIRMGPYGDTYEKILWQVDNEDQDSAKSALSAFFQGFPEGLCTLYGILTKAGMAEPLDRDLVERIMEQHPQLSDEGNGEKAEKFEGLFLPPQDSGLYSTSEASERMEKTASGSVGGQSNAYYTHGPGENRYCPKLRNVVNTYVCRYHCLDGLPIDDHQILCAEAIWRQSVMDKFSRDYKDQDGNYVGGYLNKRFEIERSTHEHPYQLKPGTRHAPINEDAWSPEKRLQEMRRAEASDREYSDTPGDPKDIYSWDPYEFHGTTESPQLYEKKRDSIAKNSGAKKPVKTANIVGSKCSACGADNQAGARQCVNCGGMKLVPKDKMDYQNQSGVIEKNDDLVRPNAQASSVRKACGVYYVTVAGRNFYGDTVKEAQRKAKELADLEPGSVQEENEDIAKRIDSPLQTPSWRPRRREEPQERQIVDPTPSTPEMPMSMAPVAEEEPETDGGEGGGGIADADRLDAYFAADILQTDEEIAEERDEKASRLGI